MKTQAEEEGVRAIIGLQRWAGIEEPETRALAAWRGMCSSERTATLDSFKAIGSHMAHMPEGTVLNLGITDEELHHRGGGMNFATHDGEHYGIRFKHVIDGMRFHRVVVDEEKSKWRGWGEEIAFKGAYVGPVR